MVETIDVRRVSEMRSTPACRLYDEVSLTIWQQSVNLVSALSESSLTYRSWELGVRR